MINQLVYRTPARRVATFQRVALAAIWIAPLSIYAQALAVPSGEKKMPIDALIPWLLQEDAQLRGIPFSEVIFDTTGKRVLAFDAKNENDARVLKEISSVLDEVMTRLNAPDSLVQGIARINEVSSHFEDLMHGLLNNTPGLKCDFPKTAEGREQRSGYPDLELVDQQSHRVYYLDPKLYAAGSRGSSFRTFYFEPKIATNKVREDAVHFIVGFEHAEPASRRRWRFTRWDLVDLSNFQVKLKAEFQGSNHDMHRPEAIVATSRNRPEEKRSSDAH